ncbi:MAG: DUF1549 and DUF1553 domain-containing protein, partial [Planctomycetota bacterium]|nr:DUF1549 and DUF1553 domain-containing protein [Planctomycetota bacterium]
LVTVAAMVVTVSSQSMPEIQAQVRKQAKKGGAKKPRPKNAIFKQNQQATAATFRVPVGTVQANQRTQILNSARKLDELVEANYRKHNVEPNPDSDHDQFVRRVYLDITGTIPNLSQYQAYHNSRSPDRRAELIDRLLNSDEYASHWYNFWAGVLRLQDLPDNNVWLEPYQGWIKDSLRANRPYDKWVHEMLTASGKSFTSPPTGYWLRDDGMPLDAMNNTVRVFLGTQIGCAQCHDHPFDKWTQKEFYEIASYTYGMQTRGSFKDIKRLRDAMGKIDPKFRQGRYNRLLSMNRMSIFDTNRALKLPHDYAYKNAKPNQVIQASVLFGSEPKTNAMTSRREAFGAWLTSRDNPRFAKTIANRLWKQLMGVGLIEPVDDMRDDSVAENPALMSFLESEMKRLNFNMKEYLRLILNSRTYRREAETKTVSLESQFHFPGPALRRMTAEQAWDSLLTLAVVKPMSFQKRETRPIAAKLDVDLAKASAQQVIDRVKELEPIYFTRKDRGKDEAPYKYKGILLARASELDSPVPSDHFLRQFGQSDREIIDSESVDGTVPQILTMFNGPITHMMLEEGSVIYSNVVKARTTDDRIDVIFFSVLGRKPSAIDRQTARDQIKRDGNAGYGNVIWALINTREFLFIQ